MVSAWLVIAMSNRSASNLLDDSDIRQLLQTATATKVAGCPNGGPIAAITLPVAGTSLPGFSATSDGGSGAAGVLRDSLVLTYDLSGRMVLPPFHALPKDSPADAGPGGGAAGGTSGGMGPMGHERMEATVCGGGCAVVRTR